MRGSQLNLLKFKELERKIEMGKIADFAHSWRKSAVNALLVLVR
jgi:hypothetical protein